MSGPEIAVIGAGNVGLPVIQQLAVHLLRMKSDASSKTAVGESPKVAIVDFDTVGSRDLLKGYHPLMLATYKSRSAERMVARTLGEEAARPFVAVVAAVQSAPGVLRSARSVFSCTDSFKDCLTVSALSRHALEMRLSTSFTEGRALHTIDVTTCGHTLLELFPDQAFLEAGRETCLGTPLNRAAGVAQPLGSLTAAIALEQWIHRAALPPEPLTIRVTGGTVCRMAYSPRPVFFEPESIELPLSYDCSLEDIFIAAADSMDADPAEIRLTMSAPLVSRLCERGCEPESPGLGFERYPVHGCCPRCGSGRTILLRSLRSLTLPEAAEIGAGRSLRALWTPAGMGVTALARDGRSAAAAFHLPFHVEDVPPLRQNPERRIA